MGCLPGIERAIQDTRQNVNEEHTPSQGINDPSFSGAEEDRTPDLFVANEALSQLSYSPSKLSILKWHSEITQSLAFSCLKIQNFKLEGNPEWDSR